MNNSIEFNLNVIELINNQTCLLFIKTFYDLPSTYQMNPNIYSIIKSLHYYDHYYDLLQWNIIIPIIIVY
ncbi:unnamed protein product [Schistosoma mattheei]|uniref:Uncharacterized protein n=1 Tax=Schistosoma mattheei TaxID=31246 RepID=A0AA85BQX2_9TREM|nr:unnamed protein product [Schistosoma mattheei]